MDKDINFVKRKRLSYDHIRKSHQEQSGTA